MFIQNYFLGEKMAQEKGGFNGNLTSKP